MGTPPLSGVLGVQVVDRTGIPATARFNYALEFSRDDNTSGPLGRVLIGGSELQVANDPSIVTPASNIFRALEEQLGLRLQPSRAPQGFIVIDHVERPSAD